MASWRSSRSKASWDSTANCARCAERSLSPLWHDAELTELILVEGNVALAGVVDGLEVRLAQILGDVVSFLEGRGELPLATVDSDGLFRTSAEYGLRLRGRGGLGARQTGAGGGRRRRAQH